MKKRLLISLSALLLSACADKNQYEEAVLAEMQKEQDIKDYKIDPAHITDCVVDLTTKKMPGLFAFDPNRMTAYRNYAEMLTLTQAKNDQEFKSKRNKLIQDFGSPKALADARLNYSESIGNCLTAVIGQSEEEELEKEKAKQQTAEKSPEPAETLVTTEAPVEKPAATSSPAETPATTEAPVEAAKTPAEAPATTETPAEVPATTKTPAEATAPAEAPEQG